MFVARKCHFSVANIIKGKGDVILEIGSIIGLIIGFVAILLGLLFAADFNIGLIADAFIDWPSIMIVFGGTFGIVFLAYPLGGVINGFKAFVKIFSVPSMDPSVAIAEIVELANLARREGILALEERALNMEDVFLKKGIMLIVDGTDPELVRGILETELSYIETRHSTGASMWGYMGGAAPSWGMIGTFIGLVFMLLNLDDPEALGPGMATALLTSLYGAVVANYICIPVETKLKAINGEEIVLKEILVEGMLSIQAGENPRIIEEKLKSFLAPALRENVSQPGGGE